MKPEPEFDKKLWFTMGDCCPGKHYLLHNPHTFPGRMGAWCPQKKVTFCVSKSAIETCSIEAQYWVRGFLAGNEPDAPVDEHGDYVADADPQYEMWRAAIKQFPETGIWVRGRQCEICGVELLPTQPGSKCPKCSAAELTEKAAT